jgi:tetratricopeptide (TPR) repeat protein
VSYYQRAADVAAGRFAHGEAVRLHRKALDIIAAMPAGRGRDRQELAVLQAMAAPLTARDGYALPDLQRALERSIELAESLGRADATVTGLAALWTSRFVQGRTADSYQVAIRALQLADESDAVLSGVGHFAVGGSAVSLGRPAEGLRHLELVARLVGRAVWLSVGTRPNVHATAWSAHAHWLLGHDDHALAACQEAIRLAREINDTFSLAVALAYGAITHQMRDDRPALRAVVDELCDLCERYQFAYYREWAMILEGWSRTDGSGIELVRRGIGNLRSQGAFARMPYWLSLLADLAAREGRADEAAATLDAAIAACRARDDLWWLPEVMRMRAAQEPDDAAAARLREAADVAAAHGSAGLLRRCERDLRDRDLGDHGLTDPGLTDRGLTDRGLTDRGLSDPDPGGVRSVRPRS